MPCASGRQTSIYRNRYPNTTKDGFCSRCFSWFNMFSLSLFLSPYFSTCIMLSPCISHAVAAPTRRESTSPKQTNDEQQPAHAHDGADDHNNAGTPRVKVRQGVRRERGTFELVKFVFCDLRFTVTFVLVFSRSSSLIGLLFIRILMFFFQIRVWSKNWALLYFRCSRE